MVIISSPNTPYVKLDVGSCTLSVSGKSYPEDPSLFYDPIVLEINKCINKLKTKEITIKFTLEMVSSTSIRYLFNLVRNLYKSPTNVVFYWYYESDDIDMLEQGQDFQTSLPKLDFHLIGVDEFNKV